jgi:hypothetical protein
LRNLQNAETGDADAVALLQVLRHKTDRIVEYLFQLPLRHFVPIGERRGKVLEGHGSLGCGGH